MRIITIGLAATGLVVLGACEKKPETLVVDGAANQALDANQTTYSPIELGNDVGADKGTVVDMNSAIMDGGAAGNGQ